MNADEMQAREFERRASAVLGESVTRVNARVRSRLNQARNAALEEIAAGRRSFWRAPVFMPATGAVAAAVLVALLLTTHYRGGAVPMGEGGQAAFDDIEMLADSDGLDLVENWDGSFYEWAAGQSEDGSDGTSG
jgi:anti-sigma-K factor RskA